MRGPAQHALRLALVALAGAMLACAADRGETPASPVPGVMRVGTSGDYPPFSVWSTAESQTLSPVRGFDAELVELLAGDLGVAIEWQPFRWPELEERVAANEFDLVASGVTWRSWRAVTGTMTRALAAGGPCLVGAIDLLDGPRVGARVAVNRGGVLERWARQRLPDVQILAVERNLDLGGMLQSRTVDAIVTDTFEISHLALTDDAHACEPPVDRKVWWVSPARAAELGPRLDAWLAEHEEQIDAQRERWLGGRQPRTELDHLLDLVARRLATMPDVAAAKRAKGLAIEDPEREARVLEVVRAEARSASLDADATEALFALQIELGKQVQARAPAPEDEPLLDLDTQLRPELERLGARMVASAARVAPIDPAALDAAAWEPVLVWLDAAESARLRAALLALRPSR
jgi:cyclohexadienyl dehydratase